MTSFIKVLLSVKVCVIEDQEFWTDVRETDGPFIQKPRVSKTDISLSELTLLGNEGKVKPKDGRHTKTRYVE